MMVGASLLLVSTAAAEPDGELDTAFGSGGWASLYDLGSSYIWDMALQPDGKIVVAGDSYDWNGSTAVALDFAIVRLTSSGALDSSFGTDGIVELDLGGDDVAYGVAIQPDGKIVAVGADGSGTWQIVRLTDAGGLDPDFDGDGKVSVDFGTSGAAGSVAVDDDGKLVVGGRIGSGTGADLAVVRLTTTGTLDTSFSGDGKTTIDFGTQEGNGGHVGIQSDGRILVAGRTGVLPGAGDLAIARLTTSGDLDTSFSGDGKQTVDFGGAEQLADMVLQSNDRIVLAGLSGAGDAVLARLTTAGALDASFGTGGKVTTDLGGTDSPGGLAVAGDGRIVVAGDTSVGGEEDAWVARYLSNGSLDPSFSGDGKAVFDEVANGKFITPVVVQPDGRILIAGGLSSDLAGSLPWLGTAARLTGSSSSSSRRPPADFDGDGDTDVSVFHAGSQFGEWNILGQPPFPQLWGAATDIPVPANYDTGPVTRLAVFREGTQSGEWYVPGLPAQQWGAPTDTPVPGDYDGDGDGEPAVFRAGAEFGEWYVQGQPPFPRLWGLPTDIPVPADYDGDGDMDIAVFRRGAQFGEWYIQGQPLILWGSPSDMPVPADYDGDGDTDIAVFRRGSTYAEWYVRGGAPFVLWGSPSDLPMPGDYDGDGDADIAVFRRGTTFGEWYIQGEPLQLWGGRCDTPLPLPYHLLELLPASGC
jgi:uncharacterized delta-60 repeat protein